jgi:hypothetical protein
MDAPPEERNGIFMDVAFWFGTTKCAGHHARLDGYRRCPASLKGLETPHVVQRSTSTGTFLRPSHPGLIRTGRDLEFIQRKHSR